MSYHSWLFNDMEDRMKLHVKADLAALGWLLGIPPWGFVPPAAAVSPLHIAEKAMAAAASVNAAGVFRTLPLSCFSGLHEPQPE